MNQLFIDKILLIIATLALFLSVLFLRKKGKSLHDYIISSWLIFLGSYVFIYAFTPAGFFINHPWRINLYISLLALTGPFLFFYVKTITHPEYRNSREVTGHLLPAILFIIGFNVLFPAGKLFGAAGSEHGISDIELPLAYLIFLVILSISVPMYILFSISLLHRHKKLIAANFSDLKKRTLTWLRNLIIILGIAWILLASIIFIHHVLLLFSDSFCINGLFITLSAFIVLAGYFGLYQPQIFSAQGTSITAIVEENDIPYSGSTLKEEDKQQYISLLSDYLIREKPYLNSQLTLHKLASDLNIPLHHLSRIINEHFNQNFFDFINQYRVNEFILRLPDPKYSNYSLLAMAFDCGFNSKTTFNRYFKKAIGLTPSEYKNKQTD